MIDGETNLPYERLPTRTRTKSSSFISSMYKSMTFSFVIPLLAKGAVGELNEYSAMSINPINETVGELTDQFTQTYARTKVYTFHTFRYGLLTYLHRSCMILRNPIYQMQWCMLYYNSILFCSRSSSYVGFCGHAPECLERCLFDGS